MNRVISKTAVTAIPGVAFLALVALMRFDPNDFVRVDALATSLTHPLQTLPWVNFFIALTAVGSTTGVVAIAVLVAVLLRKQPALVVRLILLLIAESMSVTLVKSLIGRVRPPSLPFIGPLHSFSFPSGHATAAMALFGFMAVVLLSRVRSVTWRAGIVVIAAAFILGIGLSRIVLAAHFASDVLAGYLLGAFWLAFVFQLHLGKRLGRVH